jgi:hypothetical protein
MLMPRNALNRLVTPYAASALALAGVLTTAASAAANSSPRLQARGSGINPANFVTTITNPYFPLRLGTTFTYRGVKGGEVQRSTTNVTHRTKTILGVTCVEVLDTVWVRGALEERTLDWYAQDRAGNVWYFGESSHDYKNGRVISTQGSWVGGVRGARPGIIMEAHPHVGDSYRQEYLSGVAEDRAEVSALSRGLTVQYGSFHHALMTKEWTALEPGIVEDKYYVAGVGNVSTIMVKGGTDHEQLVGITHNGT